MNIIGVEMIEQQAKDKCEVARQDDEEVGC